MPRIRSIRPEIKYFPPELIKKLECISSYPLTLLEASSGFGKTTALLNFFETGLPETAVVYKHEFTDNGIQEAWKQFCGLIARFDEGSAGKLLAAGIPAADTLPDIRCIIRSLSCRKETYLFLDDFQEWKLPHPCEFLSVLSEQNAGDLHIVAAAHPYSRQEHENLMRSRRLWLLQEEDLAFSREDTERYFRQAGLPLSGAQLDEVMELTGGWIMALYLQLDSLIRKGGFEQGGMENLMKKTFWGRLSEEEKDLLLKVSVFPSFTLSQAAAFSGLPLDKTEDRLREKHFFVRYDKEEGCYHMHMQLKKLLKSKFALLPEAWQKEICLKAGELAWNEGDRINTLRFYYYAGAWEKLLSLPFTSYEITDVIDETTAPMILNLLERTPHEIKARYPGALVPLIFVLFFLGKQKELLRYTDELNEIIRESSFPEREKNALLGELELLLSFMEYNRIEEMSKRHRKSWELLGGPAALIDAKSTWTFGSPSVLYMLWREEGELDRELAQMDECMPFYNRLTRGHGTGAELVMRAEAHLHRGETERAEMLCHRAVITAESQNQSSISLCGVFTLARLAILKGDRRMLEENRLALKNMLRYNMEDLCRNTYALADGYLSLLSGRQDQVEPWLAEGRIGSSRLVIMVQPFAYIIYGRLLIQKKEYLKLLGISEYILEISSVFPNLLPQVYLRIYRAQAFQGIKKQKEAISQLKEALKLALPDRIFLPFSENYEEIKRLLADTGCPEAAMGKIAVLAQKLAEGVDALERKQTELTPCEREVLRLLMKDMTNRQIAAELYISFSTVKKEVSSILKKLGVSSREMLKAEKPKNK